MSDKRFDTVTVIVVMMTGEQRLTQSANFAGVVIRAFREAVEAGPILQAAVVTNTGISRYTSSEVAELAGYR